MSDCVTQLTEARAALHDYMLGKSVVEVRYSDGESVQYSAANVDKLRAYVRELEAECGGTGGAAKRRAPMKVVY
ncbi:MAG: phage tail protein [Gammaproteobacteria bacterium]|nr:phage tail protein [Gammaproteobacteria bacterium]